ncbi:hypothetical protein JVX92_15090 (plasmid) [Microbacterium hominis]|uniref:hypothetical protein n=1 Tax=Microbacterium hominis TaxID=162426 RepID=UPI001966B025|nr:hypothetical protein [Microbacterium hominis]QRY42306.1 hypothetical protein JVX92_15090 [Microbacterium hominis]
MSSLTGAAMADCGGLDWVGNVVGCGAQAAVDGTLGGIGAAALKGVNDLWNGFMTSWIGNAPEGVFGGETGEWFTYVSTPIVALLVVIGLVIAGARTAFSVRGEPAKEAMGKLVRVVLITTSSVIGFSIMAAGMKALAKWILDSATIRPGDSLIGEVAMFSQNGLLAVIFGILGVIVVGVQWVFMIARAIGLTALLPFWPVAAAAGLIEKYESGFEKVTAWLIAFLIYPPVAAGIYGLAFKLRSGRDGVEAAFMGLGLSFIAVIALPALMRLLVPATAALGRAGAWQTMMGVTAAAATTAVAVGAMAVTGGAAAPAAGGAAGGAGAAAGAVEGSVGGGGVSGAGGAMGAPGPEGGSSASGSSATSPSAKSDSGAVQQSAEQAVTPASGASEPSSGGGGSSSGSVWSGARDVASMIPRGRIASVEEMLDE